MLHFRYSAKRDQLHRMLGINSGGHSGVKLRKQSIPRGQDIPATFRSLVSCSNLAPSAHWIAVLLLVICASAAAQGKASTTTLLVVTNGTGPVSTITAGTVVTLTATVASGTSAISPGQVNFCDASATYCTDIHLLGTAQLTTAGKAVLKFRPGIGKHSYKAVFMGTTANSGSSSGAIALTVAGKYSSNTTIQQTGIPGSYTLTANVTGVSNLSTAPAPTGNVSFVDTTGSNTVLATAPLGSATSSLAFLNSSNPATVEEPNAVAAADFNGDGIPDLAVSNSNSGATTLTILLGNGDGTFTATPTNPTVGLYPDSISTGDFNGDGIVDLAVSSVDDIKVTILLGNGDGTFSASPTLNTVSTPQSVATGDFNNDGIQDLAVVNATSVLIFLGNGDGTFALAPSSPSAGSFATTVAVGDFNRDGTADLAVTNGTNSGTVTILLGNGDGTFRAGFGPLATGSNTTGITIADFNGDGLLDLAACSYSNSGVNILLGNGDGTFQPAVSYSMPGLDVRSVAAADFNGDGIVDLAIGMSWYGPPLVLLGKGDGTFGKPIATTANIPLGSGYIATADFNGDGIPDIVEPNQNLNGTAVVQLVQPSQTVTATVNNINPLGPGPRQVEASYPGDSNYNASVSSTVALSTILAPLVITPASGTYSTVQSVTISESVPEATIYYSERGTTGTTGYIPYTGPIMLADGGTETISAYATETGYLQSDYVTANYVLAFPQEAVPTISLASGYYPGTQSVTLSDADSTAQIYYTTNGTVPNLNSMRYGGAISVSSSETLTAIAISSGHSFSPTVSAQYTIGTSSVPMIYTIAGSGLLGYSGDGGPATLAQVDNPYDLVEDSAGNIYFSDEYNHMVRKVTAGTGIISVVAGNGYAGDSGDGGAATSAELNYPASLALDHAGNLYIADLGSTTVRELNLSSGTISTYAGNPTATATGDGGPATSAALGSIGGLAVDAANNLYIAEAGLNTIRIVNAATGVISTIAGNGTVGFAGDGGPVSGAEFRNPTGMAFDASGNLYIIDSSNDVVRKITATSGVISPSSIITTVAGLAPSTYGLGNFGYTGDGGPATAAKLNYPAGIALDSSGNLFISDSWNGVIREVTASNGIISTFAGNGVQCAVLFGDAGPVTSASLCYPEGIKVNSAGNVIVSDGSVRIREIMAGTPPSQQAATPTLSVPAGTYAASQNVAITDTTPGASIYVTLDGSDPTPASAFGYSLPISTAGAITLKAVAAAPGYLASPVATATYNISAFAPLISTVAGNGTTVFNAAGGPALNLGLPSPTGLAVDTAGNLYVSEPLQAVVWKISASTGIASIYAGTGNGGYSGDGGPAVNAQLSAPEGLAIDSAGNLYIADTANNVVRKVTVATGTISTVAGHYPVTNNILGDGGPATSATLIFPTAVGLDGSGNLYIADRNDFRIRKVASNTGIITTVAGNGTNTTSGDGGPATSAGLQWPDSLAVDSAGDIYVGYSNGARVRKVSATTGIIQTFAGFKDLPGDTGNGGPATSAEIKPMSLAVDATGNLYVSNEYEIREINASTGVISRVAGNGYFGYRGDGGAAAVAEILSPAQVAFDAAGNLYFADNFNNRIRKVTLAASTAAAPVFSPAAGTYTATQSVTISDTTSNATIYYTTDGSTPSSASNLYTGAITVSSTETIKAIAIAVGYHASPVTSASYVIGAVTPPTPSITSITPAYTAATGAQFTLTVNGSDFTSGSAVYWGATALATTFVSSTQLKATVSAADIASPGTISVTVQTSGAGTSNTYEFEIDTAGSNTPPSFSPTSITITAGGSGTTTVTLPSSATGVSARCLNLPAGATCSYSSSTGKLTITTASSTLKGTYVITVVFTETLPGAALALVLFPFLLAPIARINQNRKKLIWPLIAIVAIAALATVTGCGGRGGSSTSPPPQTHQVTSSGAITLTVQ